MSDNVTTLERRKPIEVGGAVTLATGGPSMVVTERTADKVHVYWHVENGELFDAWLPTVALKVKP